MISSSGPQDQAPIHDLKRYWFLNSISNAHRRKFRNASLGFCPLFILMGDALHLKLISLSVAGFLILWWMTLIYREYQQWRKAVSYRQWWSHQKFKRLYFLENGRPYRDIEEELDSCRYHAVANEEEGPLTIERGKLLFTETRRRHRNLTLVTRYFIAPSAVFSFYLTTVGMPNAPEYFCLLWIPIALLGFMAQRTATLKLKQWYIYYHYKVNNCPPQYDLV